MRSKTILLSPGTASSGRGGDPTDPEAIVRVLFEKSPLLIYITDLEFKVVLFNRGLRESTGYDTSDCRNIQGLLAAFYPDRGYRKLVQGIHDGWVRNEHIRDTELVATIKDGTQRTISWSTSRLRIGRGPTIGYIAIGVDVTTRRNLQQWVALFQLSLQHLEEGVILTEPSGRVLAWSAGAERLLGYSDEEMQGRELRDLHLGGERELISRTVDRAIEAEGHYTGEVELEHKDGSNRILVFSQHRLDGDGQSALARLTLLSEPGSDEDWETRVADAERVTTELTTRLASARGEIAQRDALVGRLEADHGSATAAADEARTRIGELEDLLGALETAAAATAASAEREANDVAVKIALAEGAAADANDEMAATQHELAQVRAAVQRAEAHAADSAARVDELTREATTSHAQLASAQGQFEATSTDLDQTRTALEKSAGELAGAVEALKKSEQELAEAKGALEASNKELAEAKGALETSEKDLAESRTEAGLQATARAQEDQEAARTLSAATEDLATKSASLETAQAELEATKAELEASRSAAGEAEAELARLRTEATATSSSEADARTLLEARATELESDVERAKKLAAAHEELAAATEENRLAAEQHAKELETAGAEQDAELEDLKEKLAASAAKLTETLSELEAARAAPRSETPPSDDLAAALARVTEVEADVVRVKAEADAEAAEQAEAWVQDRAALAEQHRNQLAEAQSKAAEERSALEQQLSTDILAAEERSESERSKMLDRHEQERKEWEDAAAIARAEAESRLRHDIESLQTRLDVTGNLQPHLVPLESLALVAADTEGRVVGWSGGATLLDDRDDVEAIGAFLHKDVLRLDKVNWKAIFGKVVIGGALEQKVTLVARGGIRKDVILKARLVRNSSGQPIGVTEVLQAPTLGTSVAVHAEAAVSRLAFPLHRALETRAIAGLKSHQGASGAVRDLLKVCQAVDEGADWSEVEEAARRVDLPDLLEVTDGLVREAEDSWRELRATARDLLWLEEATRGGSTDTHRWNELVTRCLHAVEFGLEGGVKVKRKFGNQALLEGRGQSLVPLLVTLLSSLPAAEKEVQLTTSVDDDHAHLTAEGLAMDVDSSILAEALAAEAGGRLEVASGRKLSWTLSVPLALVDEDGVDAVIEEPTGPLPVFDGDATVPPSAGVNLDDLLPDASDMHMIEADALEEADEELSVADEDPNEITSVPGQPAPRRGTVQFLEEMDDGGLVLMAGEDSIVANADEIRAAIEADVEAATHPTLPEIDELEELFDQAVAVSPSVFATAGAMDAYAAGNEPDDPDSPSGAKSPALSQELKTDAGKPVPDRPTDKPTPAATPEAMDEMRSTDTGEKMRAQTAAKPATAPAPKKTTPKKKKKKKAPSRGRRKRS